jgi:hypothetical protein
MNENLSQCSVLSWEDCRRQWQNEKERRLGELQNFALEAERQLHDPAIIRAHTNRLLWRASKGVRYFRITHGLAKILTQRGCMSAPGQGDTKTGASTVGKPSPCP